VVYLGGGFADLVIVLQQKLLAVTGPFAGNSCLNKIEHRLTLTDTLHTTHQCIPLLDIIEGIDTNVKIPHNTEGLNPEQETGGEELVNCLMYFPNIRTTSCCFARCFAQN
jgi:hypothetical protein